jgi:hypothetical protein
MTPAIKTLVSAVALATLIAGTPASAQSSRPNDQQVTRDPNDVIMRGKVIGAAIRIRSFARRSSAATGGWDHKTDRPWLSSASPAMVPGLYCKSFAFP